MKTLVVSATPMELNPILQRAEKLRSIDSFLETYKIAGHTFDVLFTGVGMVATSYHLGRVLVSGTYDRVINVGIAGSFDTSIPLGKVVEIIEDQFSELGVQDGNEFIPLSELGFDLSNDLSMKNAVLRNHQSLLDLPYPKLRAITVNTVHGSEDEIEKIRQRLNPQVETMEGAAFFFACKMAQVPCIQIRAISNYVERRNKANWDIPSAVKNLNDEIVKLLSS